MTRANVHRGILAVGVADAAASLEAAAHSARVLRDEAVPESEAKATYRFVVKVLEEAAARVIDARANLDQLRSGDSCAS